MNTITRNTTFQKYPAYRDSGVEWLGEIPEHWSLLSNKNIFKLKKNQVGKKSVDYVLLSLTLKGIIQRVIEDGGKFPAEFDTYQEVKKGDFVFCLFDVEETPRCVGLSDFEGMITGAYTVMEVNPKFDRNFLYYFYLNLDADKRMRPLYTGLRNTISKDNFFAFKTFIPPLPEQTAIATFLDDKTTKIDRVIAQKQQMIALLKERKQIIIQNAVTKGLNPNVKMKDSGVEWIGEIPEEWSVEKGKWLYVQQKRPIRNEDEIITCFRDGQVTLRKNRKTEGFTNALKEHGYQGIRIGDLVIHNMDAFAGAIGVSDSDGKSTPVYSVCTERKAEMVNSSYYAYYLRELARKGYIQALAKGIRERSTDFRFNDFANLEYALPPLSEQTEIVAHIETQSAKIEKAIKLQEQQIEKLKELKSTLIDGAVTGKIMVS
ncbi:restriction endonuclease subunit S [Belliella aquatica]|uniref:Type I restriction endonuclease subunit S n=1 Tax=Belliella aquatica TaxID=1323734 RepID=A0ABQ1NAZ4_9BACT|nr:restriction endonuclease subunit S [Belliella aquatica]MCH7407411.1 restriction endonuclease subunit S [Belliella aquatica]GGC53136.1 type I restriction endonuclease subunit S [Belliella aquatica]